MNIGLWLMVLGVVSTLALTFLLIIFGRVLISQMRVWALSKRGFYMVEHIGEDNLRRYYFMKPKEDHFDIDDGFYMFLRDTITRTGDVLEKVNPDLLKAKNVIEPEEALLLNMRPADKKKYLDRVFAEKKEFERFHRVAHELTFKREAVTLRYGIPTVTYYGSNPSPVYFKEANKQYDSKILKNLYLRILLTQKWDEISKYMRYAMWGAIGIGVMLLLLWVTLKSQTDNTSACLAGWNSTKDLLVSELKKCGINSTITL